MGDIVGTLGFLFDVVNTLHDGIGSHKVGKADIRFQLTRFKSYLTDGEGHMIRQAVRVGPSYSSAERLLELHAGIAEWLEANKFKTLLGGKTKLPRWFLEKKAASLKDHVDAVQAARERLWDELQAGGVSPITRIGKARPPRPAAGPANLHHVRPPAKQRIDHNIELEEVGDEDPAVEAITRRICNASRQLSARGTVAGHSHLE